MKKIVLYFLSLGILIMPICAKGQSTQPNFTLQTNESGDTKSYIARDYVSLKPGFQFTASTGKQFNAKIDIGLIFPPTDGTYLKSDGTTTSDPTQGAAVGSIPGQFAVSPSGAATYTIPIECPAGINGMQPNISLVYNSQGGNGPLGVGWGLSGLSSISRTTKNIFSNNGISGIDFSIVDEFSLDGNRLISNDTRSGLTPLDKYYNGLEFLTENKSYAKIVSNGDIVDYGGLLPNSIYISKSPNSFRVVTKDGQTIEYGTTADSRLTPVGASVPLQWLISKITDANGNYQTFTYQSQGGETVIQKIEYTGNGSKLPFASIEFNYTNKTVINKSYILGYSMEDRFLLNNIQVKSNRTILKQYDLGYDYKTVKDKYFLKSVGLIGRNNEKLSNTAVVWGSDNNTISLTTIAKPNYSSSFQVESNNSYLSCDVDGDGVSELVEFFHLKEGTDENFQESECFRFYKIKSENGRMSYEKTMGDYKIQGSFNFTDFKHFTGGNGMFADFNGDGIRSVIIPQFDYSDGLSEVSFAEPTSNRKIMQHLESSSQMTTCGLGDINNDGKDELISIENPSTTFAMYNHYNGKVIYVKKNTNNNHELAPDDNYITDTFSPTTAELGYESPKRLIISDFNSDGLKDILVLTKTGVFFYKNNGGTLGTDGVVHTSFTFISNTDNFNSDFSTIKEGDFNGDGMIDFILNEHCNGNWKLAINNGHWGFDNYPLSNFTAVEEDFTSYNDDKEDCIVMDFNHDGKSDVILVDPVYYDASKWWESSYYRLSQTNVTWFASTGSGFTPFQSFAVNDPDYTFNRYNTTGDFDGDGREDLLTFRSDLYGGQTKTDNTLFINSAFNTNFEANQVKSVTDGLGNQTTINYQPLSCTKKSDGSGFYTKGTNATYPVVDIQAPLYCVSSVSQPSGVGNGISKSDYAYSEAKVQVTGKGFLGFKSQTVTNVLSNTQVTSTTLLDANYMPSTQTTETSIISGTNKNVSKTELLFENTLTGKVYESRPKMTVETDYMTGLTKTIENLEWDASGNLKKMKTTQGDLTETKEIVYDKYGSWAWCDNKPKTVTTVREQGTEPKYTRVMGYNYDATTGNLLTQTADPGDPNEVTTTYSDFDTFGHPKTITTSLLGNTKKRTAKMTFLGDNGRYIETKTNLLGETTTYSWDEITGVLNNEKDYRGRITSYTYNGLGQLTQTQTADGLKSATSLQWAKQNNPYHALYYKQIDASGAAPVTVWYDAHGRELAKETFGLNLNNKIFTQTVYRADGKVDHVTEPTFVGESPKIAATYGYDDYGRVTSVVTPLGTTNTTSYYGSKITTVTSPDGEKESEINSAGQLKTVKTNGKTVAFTYYSSGLTKTSTPDGGQSLTMVYDLQGKRIQLIDPDAGTVESKYNGYGELQWERQQVHVKGKWIRTVNNYSNLGLLQTITRGTESTTNPEVIENADVTTYTYDPNIKSRVLSISLKDKNSVEHNRQEFTKFDNFDRLLEKKETISGKTFTTSTEYDALGRVRKETFPSGYYTTNTYNTYSNLTEVKDNANRSIWKAIDENARGQLLHESKGGKVTTYAYDPDRYLPQSIEADSVMHYTFGFFSNNTNLEYRTDELAHQKELFIYDSHNRLTNWDVYRNNALVKQNSIAYNATTGNIDSKSDLGNLVMNYGESNTLNQPNGPYIARPNPGPHALTSIQGLPSAIATTELNVTYTDFKKIATLTESNKNYTLTYGVDDERRKSEYSVGGVLQKTRYYLGDYEEETDALSGKVRKIHYLSGGALLVNDNGVETLYYGYYDYQGSLLALVNSSNGAIEKYAYDPWGARRNPADWTQKDTRTSWLNNRGYTGHEHLDAFGIINMNGRVYDPLTSMFLSPDPYVQAPDNWLNYNRYGYCYGNPFKYTDPSGELQLGLFYLSFNIGYSANGGMSVGISAGIGIENVASVGISINHNLQNNSWSFTANAGVAGVYAYAGYDTKGGFVAGGGYSFTSMFAGASPVNISTNMTSMGAGYSANGGWGYNYMGAQFDKNGNFVDFDPSITYSDNYQISIEKIKTTIGVCPMAQSVFKSKKEMMEYLKSKGFTPGKHHINRYIYKEMEIDASGNVKGGTTIAVFHNGKLFYQSVTMRPNSTIEGFNINFNHELIHTYDNYKYGDLNDKNSYTETKAYRYSDYQFGFYKSTLPSDIAPYTGSLPMNDLPDYLINIPVKPLPLLDHHWK